MVGRVSWIGQYPFEVEGIDASGGWESMINGYGRRQNRVSGMFLSILIAARFPRTATEAGRKSFPRGKQVEAADRRLWSRSDVSKGDISQMAFINCLKRYFETRSCRSVAKASPRSMLGKWGIFVFANGSLGSLGWFREEFLWSFYPVSVDG